MKQHRVRQAKSTDDNPAPMTFVEFLPDRWVEVEDFPSHESIDYFATASKGALKSYVHFASRAFEIGIIKDWEDCGYIS